MQPLFTLPAIVIRTVINRFYTLIRNSPANDRKYGWDGTINGKRADMGSFVYLATLEYQDGSVQLIKGTITVIR